MAKVLTFFSLKGGDGKTTSCANIGISLGIIKKNILLIDLDPISNLTSSFVSEKTIDNDSSILFQEEIILEKHIMKNVANNVDLIPSNSYNLGFMFLEDNKMFNENFKKNIDKLKQKYEYILIDTAGTINEINQTILNFTDSILLPIVCEQFSLNTIPTIFSIIRKTQNTMNQNLKIEGVIITKFNKKTSSSMAILTEVNKIFEGYVYETIIPIDSFISKYYMNNQNIVKVAPWKPSAIAYTTLTKEILNKSKK